MSTAKPGRVHGVLLVGPTCTYISKANTVMVFWCNVTGCHQRIWDRSFVVLVPKEKDIEVYIESILTYTFTNYKIGCIHTFFTLYFSRRILFFFFTLKLSARPQNLSFCKAVDIIYTHPHDVQYLVLHTYIITMYDVCCIVLFAWLRLRNKFRNI